jgi:hypothetical protein
MISVDSVAVTARRTTRFPGTAMKARRTAWFSGALTWRRACGGGARRGRGGGRTVEAHVEDVKEEQASAGVWRGNDRVRVLGLRSIAKQE